jgi:hypothetical protein
MNALCGLDVGNSCNKLKRSLVERNLPFQVTLISPWRVKTFWHLSPVGNIPYIIREEGAAIKWSWPELEPQNHTQSALGICSEATTQLEVSACGKPACRPTYNLSA